VFFHLSSRHCHFVQLNDCEFLKYCRMMTLTRIVFLFLTLLFPKKWISHKYRITQSKFTLSYFILINDCTIHGLENFMYFFYCQLKELLLLTRYIQQILNFASLLSSKTERICNLYLLKNTNFWCLLTVIKRI
jgi:hypothetical protein